MVTAIKIIQGHYIQGRYTQADHFIQGHYTQGDHKIELLFTGLTVYLFLVFLFGTFSASVTKGNPLLQNN